MSRMSTIPVFACRYCGDPVLVTNLSTTQPDPTGELLQELMTGLEKVALCERCRRRQAYLASQGRSDEMFLDPLPVLLRIEVPHAFEEG